MIAGVVNDELEVELRLTVRGSAGRKRRIRREITIDEADTDPLIGTAMLEGFRLTADFRPGGKVTIKPLRRRG